MRCFRFLLIAYAVCLSLTVGAMAQQTASLDYADWKAVASRVEVAVENARASDKEFDARRAEIAEWRQQFEALLDTNESRIETIRGQIAALGAEPEEGETEPVEIASRRIELAEQLERLSTPRRAAEEAFSRANGIISEIDTILRRRQAEQLLNAGPRPINPAHWPGAFQDLSDSLRLIHVGVVSAFANPSKVQIARDNLPLVLLLVVLALVLLSQGRKWSERLALRISDRSSTASDQLAGFAVSLGQILFPVLGAIALIFALRLTELYGPRGEAVLNTAVGVTLAIFGARWLGGRVFPKRQGTYAPICTPPELMRRGRAFVSALGAIAALGLLLRALSQYDRYAPESIAVLGFPLVVLAGLVMIGLGRIIFKHDPALSKTESPGNYRTQFIRFLGRAAIVIGFISPVLAAAGYTAAAETLLFPAAITLALIAAIAILQGVVHDIYAWLMPGESAGDGLVPTLIAFLLLLLSMPLLAWIWGARVTDLTELWAQARTGIVIGDMTISPGAFFMLVIVFIAGYFLTRALQGSLRNTILPKTQIDPGGQTALVAGVGYVGIILSALIAITSAGLDLSNLAIVAGALSVGIGFGLQNIVSNFVSGIILLIERPISEGDWIEVGGNHGYVRKVSVRSTRIETFDRSDVIVPNADLVSGTVTNYTRGNTVGRAIIQVGVAYGTDTRMVHAMLLEIAEGHPMVLANPGPSVVFAGFGASSLDFEIRAILRDVNFMLSVKTELHHQIAERFVAAGIEIPFTQTDIWLRNPEELQSKPKE